MGELIDKGLYPLFGYPTVLYEIPPQDKIKENSKILISHIFPKNVKRVNLKNILSSC